MKKEKILVAMSGGVDSSVVAALLVKQGYDVTGAYMKQWSDTKDVSGLCEWKKDRRDAMRVAAHLGISLLTLDFEKEYKEWVMGYMFAEYEAGRTPNPDVMCNKFIKFDAWLKKILEMGFDAMATGHYARIRQQATDNSKQFLLCEAEDTDKDQTYFLHQLSQEQLTHTMFPLGEYAKPEVREMARKFDLPTAEREESMGICFVGEMPMKEFLQQKISKHPGNIVLEDGNVVGTHEGLSFYTIGQRHVGQLAMNNKQLTNQAPMFVVEKRFGPNELVVGSEDSPLLYKKEIRINDVHFVSGQASQFPLDCKVRLRHRQEMQNVEVHIENGEVTLLFEKKQRAVTPGQFAVLYKDGVCLGGGVIA
ncbi:MAG: tRNA 2-thiouridine(34) synthase MnmA [Candidatus Magasanikbacteria bacterium CG10_big_fil_rev_8_21_14_0_10_42_10]|uniref:tRNA-specific 2-thiouridylase MnmA n=2 Tax=Candidatus Magasanikiibacteriota TaxID=1752731 RepID=A0A2H0TZ95_9BACT|nr:MAG: tRNA 2-thiouridine(34) synthase MnmA [Candidatus Magasanikbacteria bacterium CG10_big_fil_rev_8_21_14_0_10_42_10]PIZ94766.1 MAG: tRNA 2-thiouridine(34) synthase MnmA [Candidatus Magasanikbacteria bacterium CG_4_10_14_0_2_um_filter_41_10]